MAMDLRELSDEELENLSYYQILSSEVGNSRKEIQKSYRELAQHYHPDLVTDEKAVLIFKLITRAYNTLSNEEKRKEYDKTHTVLSPRHGSIYERTKKYMPDQPVAPLNTEFGKTKPVTTSETKSEEAIIEQPSKFKSMFNSILGTKEEKVRAPQVSKKTSPGSLMGQRTYQCSVNALESIQGAEREIIVGGPEKQTRVKIVVPVGVADGSKLKTKVGEEEIFVKVNITDHEYLTRKGNDLYFKVPVTVKEALNGVSVSVPSPHGTIDIKIEPQRGEIKTTIVSGKGVKAQNNYDSDGDLHVVPVVVLPDRVSDLVSEASSAFDAHYSFNVRERFIKKI